MPQIRKISVSMSAEVIERVKLAAEATGQSVSAWLTDAAMQQLDEQSRLAIGRIAADQLVADYEAEHGAIPVDTIAEVEAFFAEVEQAESEQADTGGDDLRRVG